MRRSLAIAVIMLFALALGAHAQDGAVARKTSFGITGGLSMGNWTGSDAEPAAGESKKMRTGFAGGAFVNFPVGQSFAFQPQLLYVQKGVKFEAPGGKTTAKFDYLEVPMLLKWVPVIDGKMQPTIFAGPYLGMLMSAKVGTLDAKDSSKSTDFGITFGAGFGSKMTSGELFFDVRLDLGMSKIDDGTPQANVKNSAFLAMLGYRFGN